MQSEDFYKKFTTYVKSNKNIEANKVLMQELGRIMTDNREDFTYMLKYSGIDVPENVSDVNLINLFVDNIHSNSRLKLGAAFLISHSNKMVGFDGEEYTSNICADAVHKSMNKFFDPSSNPVYSNFDGEEYEEKSNFEGDMENLFYSHDGDNFETKSNVVTKKVDKNKTVQKQKMSAKEALIDGVAAIRKKQIENLAAAEKSKRTQMIVIGSAFGLTVLAVSIYAIMKLQKS